MLDMFGKLGDLRKKMEEMKARLDTITVEGASPGSKVKATVTGNRKLKSIEIEPDFKESSSLTEMQDYIEMAMNDALEKAERLSETEMKAAGRDLLPGFPGF